MKRLIIKIQGMTCEHCVRTVKNALLSVERVSDAEVSLSDGVAEVKLSGEVRREDITKAVEEWGYRVVSISEAE